MTIDKFGRHISKRYNPNNFNSTLLEKNIVENVENRIIGNFSKDIKYIENKLIQNFQKEVQSKVESVETNVKDLNKRLIENDEAMQGISKKIKLFEDKNNEITENFFSKVSKCENDFKTISNEVSNLEKKVKSHSDSYAFMHDIEKSYHELDYKINDIKLKLEERVSKEIENLRDISIEDAVDLKNLEERFENMYKDIKDKITNSIKTLENKINIKIKELHPTTKQSSPIN